MEAIVTSKTRESGRHYHEKEVIQFYSGVVEDGGSLTEVVRLKVYASRSRRSGTRYATIWCKNSNTNTYIRGSGRAGGGGYNIACGAISGAIRDAGIEILSDFDVPVEIVSDAQVEKAIHCIIRGLEFSGKIFVSQMD